MALFSYPRSNPDDSFGLQLLKSILSTAAGSAVSGGIQGALGNYFQNKQADANLGRQKDLAATNLAASQAAQQAQIKAAQKTANVNSMVEAMPDPAIKTGFLKALVTGGFNPDAQSATGAGPDMGPQLPGGVPEEINRRTGLFWQQNPELQQKYNEPKSLQPWIVRGPIEADKAAAKKKVDDARIQSWKDNLAQDKDIAIMRDKTARDLAQIRLKLAGEKGAQYDWRKDPSAVATMENFKQALASKYTIGKNAYFGEEELSSTIDDLKNEINNTPLPENMNPGKRTTVKGPGPMGVPGPATSTGRAAKAVEFLRGKGVTATTQQAQEWLDAQDPDLLRKQGL